MVWGLSGTVRGRNRCTLTQLQVKERGKELQDRSVVIKSPKASLMRFGLFRDNRKRDLLYENRTTAGGLGSGALTIVKMEQGCYLVRQL